MATLTELKNKVTTDLHRSDLSALASAAISAAISHYEKERWWFLEGRGTATTTAGQAFYGLPSDLLSHDGLLITISGGKEPLRQVSYREIDETDSGLYTGIPAEWAYYADQYRLYPAPNSTTYTLTLSYHKQLPALSDSGSNAWSGVAYELIRYRAGWDVAKHYMRAYEFAAMLKESEREEYSALLSLNTSRTMTGSIIKTSW